MSEHNNPFFAAPSPIQVNSPLSTPSTATGNASPSPFASTLQGMRLPASAVSFIPLVPSASKTVPNLVEEFCSTGVALAVCPEDVLTNDDLFIPPTTEHVPCKLQESVPPVYNLQSISQEGISGTLPKLEDAYLGVRQCQWNVLLSTIPTSENIFRQCLNKQTRTENQPPSVNFPLFLGLSRCRINALLATRDTTTALSESTFVLDALYNLLTVKDGKVSFSHAYHSSVLPGSTDDTISSTRSLSEMRLQLLDKALALAGWICTVAECERATGHWREASYAALMLLRVLHSATNEAWNTYTTAPVATTPETNSLPAGPGANATTTTAATVPAASTAAYWTAPLHSVPFFEKYTPKTPDTEAAPPAPVRTRHRPPVHRVSNEDTFASVFPPPPKQCPIVEKALYALALLLSYGNLTGETGDNEADANRELPLVLQGASLWGKIILFASSTACGTLLGRGLSMATANTLTESLDLVQHLTATYHLATGTAVPTEQESTAESSGQFAPLLRSSDPILSYFAELCDPSTLWSTRAVLLLCLVGIHRLIKKEEVVQVHLQQMNTLPEIQSILSCVQGVLPAEYCTRYDNVRTYLDKRERGDRSSPFVPKDGNAERPTTEVSDAMESVVDGTASSIAGVNVQASSTQLPLVLNSLSLATSYGISLYGCILGAHSFQRNKFEKALQCYEIALVAASKFLHIPSPTSTNTNTTPLSTTAFPNCPPGSQLSPSALHHSLSLPSLAPFLVNSVPPPPAPGSALSAMTGHFSAETAPPPAPPTLALSALPLQQLHTRHRAKPSESGVPDPFAKGAGAATTGAAALTGALASHVAACAPGLFPDPSALVVEALVTCMEAVRKLQQVPPRVSNNDIFTLYVPLSMNPQDEFRRKQLTHALVTQPSGAFPLVINGSCAMYVAQLAEAAIRAQPAVVLRAPVAYALASAYEAKTNDSQAVSIAKRVLLALANKYNLIHLETVYFKTASA